MVGIVGIFIADEENDSDLLVQRMSEAIRHRGCETVHRIKHNDIRCLVVGAPSIQAPDDNIIIIDRNEDLIHSELKDNLDNLSDLFGVVVVIFDNMGMNLFRSLDGTRVLYYGEIENCLVFATEKKSLWALEITSVKALQPGQRLTQPWVGNLTLENYAVLEKQSKWDVSREGTIEILERELLGTFSKLKHETLCAVLFSGGVDSSLAAVLSAQRCDNIVLLTASSEGSHDENAAAMAATLLDLPHQSIKVNSENIWRLLPELIYSIETSNQMDVEIAIPFYLASKEAAEEGFTTVVSGQGPDELFAGYAKHLQTYVERGPDALTQQLWTEVSITHERNIERDERAIAAHGVDSFFPYLNPHFVSISLSIPVKWKVNPEKTPQRKVLFRELARLMGVPEEIAFTPKTATQYSSGSSRILLDSVIEHVDEFRGMSRKKASRRVQEVLKEIGYAIHMPITEKKKQSLHMDLEPVNNFLEKRNYSSSRNKR